MKKTALVVDDLKCSRLTISTFLMVIGFDVVTVEDGLEGIKALKEKNYDVVFTDIEMPNMNGFELIKRIRNNNQYKTLPIIVISSFDDQETNNKVKDLLVSCQIYKPFNKEKMIVALKSAGIVL